MIGLDTNVLLRVFVIDDGEQSRQALRFFARECSSTTPGYVNCVVLAEVIWVLDTSYRYTRDAIARIVAQLLDTEDIRIEARDEVAAALRAYPKASVNFTDILIAELNRRAGCSATATFDRKAARLDGFKLLR